MTTTPSGASPEVPSDDDGRSIRLRDAMPTPLLVVFVITALIAVTASVVVLIRPPAFEEVLLQERRPPPASPYSHDPVRVFPAPIPDEDIAFDPPCEAVATADPVGGVAFVRRVTSALSDICTLQGASVGPQARAAIGGFAGTEIRIAEFERSGIESTIDFSTRTIYVNLKLTRRDTDVAPLIPVLLHEAWHLAHSDRNITAAQELDARRAEHEACRQFIRPTEWPRWCEDAAGLVERPEAEALALLVSAGYAPGVSS